MSGEVGRKSGRQVSIGPDFRKLKTPLILTAATVLLVIDESRWHLLRHAFGASSSIVVVAVVIIWMIWGIRRYRRRGK